jgi:hypothetical protein
MWAIDRGHQNIFKVSVCACVYTCVHVCARVCLCLIVRTLQALLAAKARVDARDVDGQVRVSWLLQSELPHHRAQTCLHYAAMCGRADMIDVSDDLV